MEKVINEITRVKKGDEVTLEIESLAFGGRGIARVNGLVVFVDDSLPGQKIRVRIFRKRRDYAEARTLEIIKHSNEEIEAKCPHFGECGGCRLQNLKYDSQLKYKQHLVVESLERIGAFANPPVSNIIPSRHQYYYRNKMEFSFGSQRWISKKEIEDDAIIKPRNFALGLHIRGRFDKVLDIDICYLQSSLSVEILQFVRGFSLKNSLPPYNTKDHSGYFRNLVIREGKNTGETMINLVTTGQTQFDKVIEKMASALLKKFPDITTIIHNITKKKAQVAFGDEERILYGPGFIKEKIGDITYQISANSFFQTNTDGAKLLYDKVIEFANFQEDETVYDLYSGAGTISLYIANKVKQVFGFELIEAAVKDAETNRQLNGVQNCTFIQGDLIDTLSEGKKLLQPNTIIIDPPRAGMHVKVLQQVFSLKPQKIVYVSCNPTTFARDAKLLCESDYSLDIVQPVDMFPMTPHIERVSLFQRK